MADSDRFWAKVRKDDECWVWLAYCNKDGYGQFKVGGIALGAHRYSLILNGIDIPEGMSVLHKCDNPPCVNPSHLYVGTQSENVRDKMNRNRHRVTLGEEHYAHILSANDVVEIRKRIKLGEKISHLAKEYGVAWSTIGNIKYNSRWKHT